jgi:hypothetical protein
MTETSSMFKAHYSVLWAQQIRKWQKRVSRSEPMIYHRVAQIAPQSGNENSNLPCYNILKFCANANVTYHKNCRLCRGRHTIVKVSNIHNVSGTTIMSDWENLVQQFNSRNGSLACLCTSSYFVVAFKILFLWTYALFAMTVLLPETVLKIILWNASQ